MTSTDKSTCTASRHVMRVYVSEGRIIVHYWKGDNHTGPSKR